MKKLISLSVLLLAVVFLAGCAKTPAVTNSNQPQTYINDEYKFSFEYPNDWEFVEKYSMVGHGFINNNGYQEYDPRIYIHILQNPDNKNLVTIFNEEYDNCLKALDPNEAYGCFNKNEIMNTANWQKTEVNGANAFRSGEYGVPEGADAVTLYIEQDGYYIVLRGSYNKLNEDYNFPPIFEKVISSFKFLK